MLMVIMIMIIIMIFINNNDNDVIFLQNKEWLCLTCQMQRAAADPTMMMKSQTSPNKVSTSVAKTSPTKEITTIQRSGKTDENHQEILTASGPRKEDMMLHAEKPSGLKPGSTKEKTTGSPPATEVPTTPLNKGTAVTFDNNNPPLAQTIMVDKDIRTSQSFPATKDIDKKEENTEIVQKSADKPDEVKPKQTLIKESNLESLLPESTPPAPQPTNQESGGFFSSSNPKSQLATSKTAEAVTGKMLGFGSSLFSSASTLITSAVQESRTTPPNSRKMSAPAQISNKVSGSEIASMSGPPVSSKTMLTKETKPPTSQKLQKEKEQDTPPQAEITTLAQTSNDRGLSDPGRPEVTSEVGKSTCPLCKADLNLSSRDPANCSTCTECKTLVCSKCGFSPMPSVKEVITFLNP